MAGLDTKIPMQYQVNVFDEKALADAMNVLGWREEEGIILNEKNEKVNCDYCKGELAKKSIVAFFPGSAKVVCDRPGCFLLALKKYEKEK